MLTLWREPRPVPPPPPRGRRDYALVGILLALTAFEGLVRVDLPLPAVWLAVTAALIPTLLWRRDKPLLMLAIAFGVAAVVPFLTGGVVPEMYVTAFMVLLPYSVFRWGSGREIVLGIALILAKMGLSVVAGQLPATEAAQGLAVLAAVAAIAVALRYRAGARARERRPGRAAGADRHHDLSPGPGVGDQLAPACAAGEPGGGAGVHSRHRGSPMGQR